MQDAITDELDDVKHHRWGSTTVFLFVVFKNLDKDAADKAMENWHRSLQFIWLGRLWSGRVDVSSKGPGFGVAISVKGRALAG